MANLISKTIAQIGNVVKELQVKRFLAVVLVGFLLLTTNVAQEHSSKALTEKIDQVVHQNDSQRPKTTGEWNKEARETEDAPRKRLQKIATQSGEAFKDFGSLYPDTVQRSADAQQE